MVVMGRTTAGLSPSRGESMDEPTPEQIFDDFLCDLLVERFEFSPQTTRDVLEHELKKALYKYREMFDPWNDKEKEEKMKTNKEHND